jgi:hypothetical protein
MQSARLKCWQQNSKVDHMYLCLYSFIILILMYSPSILLKGDGLVIILSPVGSLFKNPNSPVLDKLLLSNFEYIPFAY